ncbi:hypothetical protein ACJH6J_02245 [Mycobacterium sp. SMC-18]|uniref:hypothetical protein n=1 Tax=Mycobacterium sp. SMC-18 TaxID=3381629 RepID=UPI003876F64C
MQSTRLARAAIGGCLVAACLFAVTPTALVGAHPGHDHGGSSDGGGSSDSGGASRGGSAAGGAGKNKRAKSSCPGGELRQAANVCGSAGAASGR